MPNISVSLSTIALCSLVGAGVAVGSGVGECAAARDFMSPPAALQQPPPASAAVSTHPSPSDASCALFHLRPTGMMSLAALEQDKQQKLVVAHSPAERVVISRGFAASAAQHQAAACIGSSSP